MAADKQTEATTSNGRCAATTRSGKPCGGYAVAGSLYCFAHDPARAKERKAARSSGGKARHGRRVWSDPDTRASINIRTVDDILALLEWAIVSEMVLENSHSRNATVGRLATAALKALEVGELEQRIARLEGQNAAQST